MFFNMFFIFMISSFFSFFYGLKLFMEGEKIIFELDWFFFSILDMKMYFYIDWISMFFLSLVSLISSFTFLFSKTYMSGENFCKQNLFIILTFLFVVSMILTIFSLNLFFIMLGWDGLGLVSYCLVVFYNNEMSNYSGMITILTNRLGDIFIILSMFFVMNFYSLDLFIVNNLYINYNIFMIMVVLGAFTKSAQFPFSAWLPLAMAAPTPISALVHSSTLVTAGVYLILRLNMMIKYNFSLLNNNILYMVLLTMFFSGVCALGEMDFKKIIALSTLSQLGVMMMILFSGYEIFSFYHLLTHALFKALLFMCSGVFIHEFLDFQDIRGYFMAYKNNVLVSGVFLMASFSLMGFPFLSGFYSKDLILEMMYMLNYNMGVMLVIIMSTMLTSLYSLRLMYMGLWKSMQSGKVYLSKVWDGMYYPVTVMMMLVIFLGSILNLVILTKLDMVYLSFNLKMINLLLIVSSFLISLMFKNMMNLDNKGLFKLWISKMWFLTESQGILYNKIMKNSWFYMKVSDSGWLEYSIVMGFWQSSNNMYVKLNMYKFLNYKYTLLYIMLIMMIVIYLI